MDSRAAKLTDRALLAELASNEGVWDWDAESGYLEVSPRFRSLVGLPLEQPCLAQHWFDLIHPDDRDWMFACFEGARRPAGPVSPALPLPSGIVCSEPFYMEHRVQQGRGDWRWLACRGVAMLDEAARPLRLVGTVSEISEVKRAEQRLRESDERYALAAAAASDGLYDWDLLANKIDYSPRWKAILGFEPQDISDSPVEWLGRVIPDDLIWLQATLEEQIQPSGTPVSSFQIEYRIRDAHETVRWMVCRGMAVRDDAGHAVRMIGSQADITERKDTEQRLRLSEERYALAARGASDGLWDWRFDTGETYFSPRCLSMLGYAEGALVNRLRDWFKLVVSDDRPALKNALREHLRGASDHLSHEYRMRCADGAVAWCLARGMAVYDSDQKPIRIAGSVTDITARKKAELRLRYNAFHDGLTGLPNRALLLDRIGQAIARQHSVGGRHFAVLLLDIDRFKSINDSLGTTMGDLVLTTTAARLLRVRRPGDTLARLSADEFALLIEDASDPATALLEAQHIGEAVARPFHLESQEIVLTASIGMALSVSGYHLADDMLRDASLAMVRAKSNGRSRVEVYDAKLRDQALTQVRVESELRRALDENQLCVYYQPIVRLDSRRIAGVEALLRWQHPERGLVSPAEFIPLAEDSGLIIPIGRWVLETAAAQLVAWRTAFPAIEGLFTCVNVSTRQLRDDDLFALVERVLRRTGVPAPALKLEITESMLMMEQGEAEPVMRAINELGVRFSIDDFGTGYSSLSYLHRVPADTLKIDKSFVQAIGKGHEHGAIVQLISSLADMLEMEVVAEGIETEGEEQFLRSLNCRYGQGYLFGRPMPADQLGELLAKTPIRRTLR